MGKLPEGDLPPLDGALAPLQSSALSLYLHIPYCTVRCGYCDFNTYTLDELHRDGVVSSPANYIDQAIRELEQARNVLGDSQITIPTIFVGGGTPTLMASQDLGRFFARARDLFDFDSQIEITVEANPDSVSEASLAELRNAGATRISVGMQSAVPHVLAVLERTHQKDNVERAVSAARRVGFEHVSLDLIYGVPTETIGDWQQSLNEALSLDIDHVSAYALIVEEGTRLAREVSSGAITMPDDDETAEKYLLADQMLSANGLSWYEVSNWSLPGGECRHNLAYWRSENWWGIGPGAHSHVDGVRWWNVKHPSAYAARIAEGHSPAQARETLTAAQQEWERILLRLRLRDGLSIDEIGASREAMAERFVDEGLLERGQDSYVLTSQGRLMADAVVRDLVD
jgi:putative oxygen-independent coproporphyrinogen III oxidase